jgi:hypothetical protein
VSVREFNRLPPIALSSNEGEPPDRALQENEAYDVEENRWVPLATMPYGRQGFGGGTIGDSAYFVGGSLTPGDGGATDRLWMFHSP